jgi:hypothetical protein
LHYSTFLKEVPGALLPVFTEINIKPTGEIKDPTFEDAYPENRMLSHALLALKYGAVRW